MQYEVCIDHWQNRDLSYRRRRYVPVNYNNIILLYTIRVARIYHTFIIRFYRVCCRLRRGIHTRKERVSAVRRRRPPPDFRRTCGEKKRSSRELRACIRFTGSIELRETDAHILYESFDPVQAARTALICNMHSAPSPHTPQYNIFYLHAYVHRVIIIYYVHNV